MFVGRQSLAIVALGASLALGCVKQVELESPAADGADASAQPAEVLIPWGAAIGLQAGEGATWTLRPGDADGAGERGRVVPVLGREGQWWIIDPSPIEHLDHYALRMYVAVDAVETINPAPPGSDAVAEVEAEMVEQVGILAAMLGPPLQSGSDRPAELLVDYRVEVGAKVYWPDGREAGEVRSAHAFVDPGQLRATEAGERRCFDIVAGPDPRPAGELCFAAEAVTEVELDGGFVSSLWGDTVLDEDLVGGIGVLEGIESDAGLGSGSGARLEIEHVGDLSAPEPELPSVEIVEIEVAGPDPALAKHAIEVRLRTVGACVAEQEQTDALALELAFEVDDAGKVRAVELPGAKLATGVEGCIERAVRRWHFRSGAPGTITLELRVELLTSPAVPSP